MNKRNSSIYSEMEDQIHALLVNLSRSTNTVILASLVNF